VLLRSSGDDAVDPIKNPFQPGAGTRPPELAGRDDILEDARILIGRVKEGRTEKSIIMTGLRGVGKTVLLNTIRRNAEAEAYRTITIEATPDKTLGEMLAMPLRELLYDIDLSANLSDKVKRAFAVLKGFVSSLKVKYEGVEIGLNIDPAHGVADTGDITADLPALLLTVAEAAQEKNVPVALFIDEIQYLTTPELRALIQTMHLMQQRELPLIFIGAGVSVLLADLGNIKTYVERLFNFRSVGALSKEAGDIAIKAPLALNDVGIEEAALDRIYELTQGYPYFIQEWAYLTWNHAASSPITLADVNEVTPTVIGRLDEGFFRVRIDRVSESEQKFMQGMALLGKGPCKVGDLAKSLGVPLTRLSPARASLIKKGMIYSPEHGQVAFTVPMFDEFIRRTMQGAKSLE
jgi:hypothetical protein